MNISKKIAKKFVGKGWSKLIDEIYEFLPEDITILQVKEKFGGLRFYVASASEEVLDRIYAIEERSLTICDVCGRTGQPTTKGWIATRCDKHKKVGDV